MSGPVELGGTTTWLAVRSEDPRAVAAALGLRDSRTADWRTGIDAAFAGIEQPAEVFVTPPLAGWVLVVGTALVATDVGERHAVQLSHALATEVQYFRSHPGREYFAWTRTHAGRLTRSYEYFADDDAFETVGEPTEIERRLGFPQNLDELLRDDPRRPDEASVLKVAGAWSLNPLRLPSGPASSGVGVVGRLAVSARPAVNPPSTDGGSTLFPGLFTGWFGQDG